MICFFSVWLLLKCLTRFLPNIDYTKTTKNKTETWESTKAHKESKEDTLKGIPFKLLPSSEANLPRSDVCVQEGKHRPPLDNSQTSKTHF